MATTPHAAETPDGLLTWEREVVGTVFWNSNGRINGTRIEDDDLIARLRALGRFHPGT